MVWVIAHVDVCGTNARIGELNCGSSRAELRIFVSKVSGESRATHFLVSRILVQRSTILSRSERPADTISLSAFKKMLRQIWFGKQDCGFIDAQLVLHLRMGQVPGVGPV